MRAIDKFKRYSRRVYNGQDVLKNQILDKYPIHYTNDTDDLTQVDQYDSDYVWLVDENIELYRSFPLWFKPRGEKIHYMFPYVYKDSKRVRSWKKVQLVPTKQKDTKKLTLTHICGEYDVMMGKDQFDIIFLGDKTTGTWETLQERFPFAIAVDTYQDAIRNSQTDMFWLVFDDLIIDQSFNFDFKPDDWSFKYPHMFLNGEPEKFDGIFLMPKKYIPNEKEIEYRFFVSKKAVNINASCPRNYDSFKINTYTDYQRALKETKTDLFWAIPDDVVLDKNFDFSLNFGFTNGFDRNITHVFKNGDVYDGIALFSKNEKVTEKEFNYRFYATKKEWDIVASNPKPYDQFKINSYIEYLDAAKKSTTNMFWAIPDDVTVSKNFKFDLYFTHHNAYDRDYVHVFKNGTEYDGIALFPTERIVTEKEFNHRFYAKKKEHDIVASKPKKYNKFEINSYVDYLDAMENSKTEMFWSIPNDVKVSKSFKFDLYFTHHNTYDRNTNHIMLNGKHTDGIVLFSKNAPVTEKEFNSRFYINKKDWDIVASTPKPYDVFVVDSYTDYLNAYDNSTTEMFWMSSNNIKIKDNFDLNLYFPHYNTFDRNINHSFWHDVNNELLYEGLFLCSRNVPLTENEVEHRMIVKRKEWEVVASGPVEYEKFVIRNYNDYKDAVKNSKTEMFWSIPEEAIISPGFDFSMYFSHSKKFDRNIHHVFKNGDAYDGVALLSKHVSAIEHEITHRFYANKKQYDIVASNPIPYDIVFISNNEDRANDNYSVLQQRFPSAKRVHGVKGIHQAHIAAAKLCDTDMIWIVDADAEIIDNFNFDYYVPKYDPDSKKTVHVWKSQNPINSLVYGYGAVKLLPREMTLNMDTSKPDMTTSISPMFKSINRISNITRFNTDPYSTWKSAFRETVKLASRTINGQLDEETDFRLNVWCTRGKDKPFGEYCIAGALAGKEYGLAHTKDDEALRKINDFDWLEKEFKKVYQSV